MFELSGKEVGCGCIHSDATCEANTTVGDKANKL